MNPEKALGIITAGESLEVEFKSEKTKPLSDAELVESVVCLANRLGTRPGYLFIGVEDDGKISGSRPRHEGERTDPLRIQAMISNRTRPSLTVRVSEIGLRGLPVIIIEIHPARSPVSTADGKFIRRALGG